MELKKPLSFMFKTFNFLAPSFFQDLNNAQVGRALSEFHPKCQRFICENTIASNEITFDSTDDTVCFLAKEAT